jgi:hypothetical protein
MRKLWTALVLAGLTALTGLVGAFRRASAAAVMAPPVEPRQASFDMQALAFIAPLRHALAVSLYAPGLECAVGARYGDDMPGARFGGLMKCSANQPVRMPTGRARLAWVAKERIVLSPANDAAHVAAGYLDSRVGARVVKVLRVGTPEAGRFSRRRAA